MQHVACSLTDLHGVGCEEEVENSTNDERCKDACIAPPSLFFRKLKILPFDVGWTESSVQLKIFTLIFDMINFIGTVTVVLFKDFKESMVILEGAISSNWSRYFLKVLIFIFCHLFFDLVSLFKVCTS